MDALQAIMTRRSTRIYKPEVPEKELIEKVIEAGRYAPSGSNSQTTHFIVITNGEILGKLAEIVRGEFAKMEITENTYISLKQSIYLSQQGTYVFYYNSPMLIVTANKKGYGNAMADSACALENMMIAANDLDLGSCWINQLHWLDDSPAVRECLESLGLGEDETITGALALGYAATDDGLPVRKALERKGNPVTWVE